MRETPRIWIRRDFVMSSRPARNVEETRLWRKFVSLAETDGEPGLPTATKRACETAAERAKQIPAYAPQFTLHDGHHMVRTADLMGRILGPTLECLKLVEISLLLLAAHYHDLGMVPSSSEVG
jgi:hypothetical protein